MPGDALLPARCAPHCDIPPVPLLLTGAVLRHYRIAAELSYPHVKQATGISDDHLRRIESAQRPVREDAARTLLRTYGAPETEAQAATTLLARGHAHQAEIGALRRGRWVSALKGASHMAVLLSAGPLEPVFDAVAPVAAAPGRMQHLCRILLLLHERVLDTAPAQQLAQLADLAGRRVLVVRVVPEHVPAPEGLVSEWTLTVGIREEGPQVRVRRQLYVGYPPGQATWARNGRAAAQPRKLVQAAITHSRPSAGALQMEQAAQRPRVFTAAGGRPGPDAAAGEPAAAPRVTMGSPVPGVSPTRIRHALLGGGGRPAGRVMAQRLARTAPWWPQTVLAQARHGQRMVRHLAAHAEQDQFLDLSGGLPGARAVHRIASAIRPCRTVYVDRDPAVVAAWRAALAAEPDASATAVLADLAEPKALLETDAVRALDWTSPIAVLAHDVSHFWANEVMDCLMEVLRKALPPGSVISLTQLTATCRPASVDQVAGVYRQAGISLFPRHPAHSAAWHRSWPAYTLNPDGVLRWHAMLTMRTPGWVPFARPAFWPASAATRPPGRERTVTALTAPPGGAAVGGVYAWPPAGAPDGARCLGSQAGGTA
ncbi:SAM-dependent methyltransferase [Streptomyces rubradiris]|uniref:SAM-dependent methyltransferase n=1 Tax=Streptomyces rubradiris TaxID=285531 RepID=UPI0036F0D33E